MSPQSKKCSLSIFICVSLLSHTSCDLPRNAPPTQSEIYRTLESQGVGICKLNRAVQISFYGDRTPITIQDLSLIRRIDVDVELSIVGSRQLSQLLPVLQGSRIVSLHLVECSITDQDLLALPRFPRMQFLYMNDLNDDLNIGAIGISSLSLQPKLCQLELHDASLDDEALANLADIQSLEGLYMSRCIFSSSGWNYVANIDRLIHLYATDSNITTDCLDLLAEKGQLESLNLTGCELSPSAFAAVSKMSKLRHLDLSETEVTDSIIDGLTGLADLEHIVLVDTSISDDSVRTLALLKRLHSFALDETNISDRSVDILMTLEDVSRISTLRTNLSDNARARLRAAFPEAYIPGEFDGVFQLLNKEKAR